VSAVSVDTYSEGEKSPISQKEKLKITCVKLQNDTVDINAKLPLYS